MTRPFRALPRSFYRRAPATVARELLGRYVVRRLEGKRLTLRIVETEAYLGEGDRASHAWGGRRTRRTESLFRDGGFAYVYFVYGMHHMLNVVTGMASDGTAVLIRAGVAVEGETLMAANRRLRRAPRAGDLAGGPAKLCQALAIDLGFDRAPLDRGDLRITAGEPDLAGVARGVRVGVDYAEAAADWPLRFAYRGHPEASRPRL